MAVGSRPVVGSEAPSQSLPQGQRDSLAPGRECYPHTKKGALTQPSQAHRAVVPGNLPMAVGGAVGARQGAWSLPTRRGGTRFPGQQLTSQPASQPAMACTAASHPLLPQARPSSLLLGSGLEPSWALGARVTVSGLAGPKPGLCQLAIATATSHYLAWPAREGY